MSRPVEVASLVLDGYTPSEIANMFHISITSVIQYINVAIGDGLIRGSDVIFNIKQAMSIAQESLEMFNELKQEGDEVNLIVEDFIDTNDYDIYSQYQKQRIIMKDMYDDISNIEITLHDLIKRVLKFRFTEKTDDWWYLGIPLGIRQECVTRQQEDLDRVQDPYCYSDFIHLQEIIKNKWPIFSNYLPRDAANDKQMFLDKFIRLNHIRNIVMHPVKQIELSEDDFIFIRDFFLKIQPERWQWQSNG